MQVDVGNGSVWLVPDYTPSSESTKTLDSPERLVYTPGRRGRGVGDAAHQVAPVQSGTQSSGAGVSGGTAGY